MTPDNKKFAESEREWHLCCQLLEYPGRFDEIVSLANIAGNYEEKIKGARDERREAIRTLRKCYQLRKRLGGGEDYIQDLIDTARDVFKAYRDCVAELEKQALRSTK